MRSAKICILAVSVLGLATGCTQQGPMSVASAMASSSIDQANLCEVKHWQHDDVAAECKPGQKVAFLPESFGNEQLPVIFAAVNCDLRYTVALTTGGVTCIYSPITVKPAPAPTKP